MGVGRFAFRERLRGFGRKNQPGGGGPPPTTGGRKPLALGMNMPFIDSNDDVDLYWNLWHGCVWKTTAALTLRSRELSPVDSTDPKATYINTSADGNTIVVNGVTNGTIRMDYDGRIYPKANSLSLTSLVLNMQKFIEPGRVVGINGFANNLFLVDFNGPCQISSMVNCSVATIADLAGDSGTYPNGGDLGNGRYILKFTGINTNTSLTISVASTDINIGVKPDITPFGTQYNFAPYNYDASRMLHPAAANRLNAVCSFIRFLNVNTVNHDSIGGNDALNFAERTVECYRTSSPVPHILNMAQRVRLCNDAGVGMWYQPSDIDSLALISSQASLFALVVSDYNFVEITNEPWNATFPEQRIRCILNGIRKGYHVPNYSSTVGNSDTDTAHGIYSRTWINANCQPIDVKWGGSYANESATKIQLDPGDIYFTAIGGIGYVALRTAVSKPVNTKTPASYSSSTTYHEGDVVWLNSDFAVSTTTQIGNSAPTLFSSLNNYAVGAKVLNGTTLYVALQASGPSNGGAKSPATAANVGTYWRLATVDDGWVLRANYTGTTPLAWDIVSNASASDVAGMRWRATRLKDAKAIIDAAFDAVGKPRPLYVVNIQQGSTTNNVIDKQLKAQLDWDGCVDVIDMPVSAPYLGASTAASNANRWPNFPSYGSTGSDMPGLLWTDKWAMYDPDVDADTAVATLRDKMLSPAMQTLTAQAEVNVMKSRKAAFRAYLNARGRTSKVALVGAYEAGWAGFLSTGSSVLWPEERAGWDSSTSPHHGVQWTDRAYAVNSFTYDGGGNTSYGLANDRLYRCVQATTAGLGQRPSTDDGTYWRLVSKTAAGYNRQTALMRALMSDSKFGDWRTTFHTLCQQQIGDGYYTEFDLQANMPTEPFGLFSWGHMLTSDDVTNPSYLACVATNTAWKALP